MDKWHRLWICINRIIKRLNPWLQRHGYALTAFDNGKGRRCSFCGSSLAHSYVTGPEDWPSVCICNVCAHRAVEAINELVGPPPRHHYWLRRDGTTYEGRKNQRVDLVSR